MRIVYSYVQTRRVGSRSWGFAIFRCFPRSIHQLLTGRQAEIQTHHRSISYIISYIIIDAHAICSNFFDPRAIPSDAIQFSPLKSPDTWARSSPISTMPRPEEHQKEGDVGLPWRRRALPRPVVGTRGGALPSPP
jgi:hypothetical protein